MARRDACPKRYKKTAVKADWGGGNDMQYAFEMDIAKQYGVAEAIFVHRLYWWVRHNADNGHNLRDGRYWTYDSLTALTEIFPCWTRRQLEGIINRCRKKGLILTADYNTDRRNRTTWYTVTQTVMQAYADIPERGNAMPQTEQCTSPNGDAHFTKRGNLYKEQLKDQLEDERAHARAKTSEQAVDRLKPYGEFGNVLLTDKALTGLLTRWTPAQVRTEIEALSVYMQSKGKRYADHYATLLGWLHRDCPPQSAPAGRILIDED